MVSDQDKISPHNIKQTSDDVLTGGQSFKTIRKTCRRIHLA